ncbi:MAG TPA: tetratricopeptide repeat protein, partial [bacterium]|nr:tetratricopeptide repeat protein [bacterium]
MSDISGRSNTWPRRLRRTGASGRRVAMFVVLLALLLAAGCSLMPTRSGSGGDTVEIVLHAVSQGETLESIGDDFYGTPRAASYLAEINGIEAGQVLEPGSTVEVPVGAEDVERYRRRTEAKIIYNRGTILADAGDYAKAKEEFTLALRADPRFVDAGYNLAVVMIATGEPERAVAILEQVMAIRPDVALFEFALGKAHFDAERVPEALEHFENAVRLDPSLEDARFAQAVALLG